jgi:hypothetical protein
VHTVVADPGRAALLTGAGVAVADPVKAGQFPLLRSSIGLDLDVAPVQASMPELHCALEMLRIERPLLGAANISSIRQCSCPTCAVEGQPLVGAAQGDPHFCSQFSQGAVVAQRLRNQLQPASLRQADIGVCVLGR